MKKKVFSLLLALCTLFALAGCSLFPSSGASDGNFPYDIAVQGGYSGSESEWLAEQTGASTVYRRMYEEATADGSFSGTYFQFLEALSLSGDGTPYVQRALLSVVSVVSYFKEYPSENGSAGAGVVIELDKASGDAYILTNYHVVYNTSRRRTYSDIGVYLYGGEYAEGKIDAAFYGGVADEDIAVLKVTGSDILRGSDVRAAALGDSDALLAGERVYAIGNPDNENISVTSGILSMELEYCRIAATTGSGYMLLPEMRIDAPVNEGNSGGGLFNAAGELVGIVNARSEKEDIEDFGYAIPGNYALACYFNIRAGGGTAKIADPKIDYEVAASKAVYDEGAGAVYIEEKLVVNLYSGGAGAVAGVRSGDTLVSGTIVRGGTEVETVQFRRSVVYETFLFDVRKGDTVRLTVSRDGAAETLLLNFTSESAFRS